MCRRLQPYVPAAAALGVCACSRHLTSSTGVSTHVEQQPLPPPASTYFHMGTLYSSVAAWLGLGSGSGLGLGLGLGFWLGLGLGLGYSSVAASSSTPSAFLIIPYATKSDAHLPRV